MLIQQLLMQRFRRFGITLSVFCLFVTSLSVRAEVIDLIAILDASQEASVDAATPQNAGGTATMNYDTDTNMLSWQISFSGLSDMPTAAHFHGPGAPGVAAGVIVNIGAGNSPLSGSAAIDPTDEADLLGGLWYINIHTALNGGGEIRGQVFRQNAVADQEFILETTQEVPPVEVTTPADAAGSASVIFDPQSNLLVWSISFSGLSGDATGAHFHGPASSGVNAGVKINIGDISGLTSPLFGSTMINDIDEPDILNGLWYINVHTALNPGGEIRGQVFTEIFTDQFESD